MAKKVRQSQAGACKECKGIRITDQLWICPHKCWGWASNLKGAEAEARRLLKAAGGYQRMLARQQAAAADNWRSSGRH